MHDFFTALEPPIDDGPPPMAWDEYTARVIQQYRGLLDGGAGEREMQRFFERHPPMLPGAFPEMAGHGAFLDAVVAQPPLRSLGTRIPDFMWIARHSGAITPVLIEIESPHKPWLAGRRPVRPAAELTHALAQLREWREWFDTPANRQIFLDCYRIPEEWRRRRLQPKFMLIYGRVGDDRERELIGKFRADDSANVLLSYDHLEPRRQQVDYISVRNDGNGRYTAHEMPACARIGPTYDDWWRLVVGFGAMVERNSWIDPARKAFLLRRIAEWDMWAESYERRHAELIAAHRARRSEAAAS